MDTSVDSSRPQACARPRRVPVAGATGYLGGFAVRDLWAFGGAP